MTETCYVCGFEGEALDGPSMTDTRTLVPWTALCYSTNRVFKIYRCDGPHFLGVPLPIPLFCLFPDQKWNTAFSPEAPI